MYRIIPPFILVGAMIAGLGAYGEPDGGNVSAMAAIPSQIVPPATESLIIFTHKGEVLAVGQRTGKVSILGQGGGIIPPEPITPTPGPTLALTGLLKNVRASFIDMVFQALQ